MLRSFRQWIAQTFAPPLERQRRRRLPHPAVSLRRRLEVMPLEDRTMPSLGVIEVSIPIPYALDTTEGGSAGNFRVSRDSTSGTTNVNIIIDGTATSGDDYTAISSVITIPNGQSYVDVSVSPIDDSISEATETVSLTIDTGSGYTIGGSNSATISIFDNDTPEISVQTISDAAEGGADGTFRLTRIGDLSSALTVSYSVDGTAIGEDDEDYQELSGSVTFAANEDTVDITVDVTDDSIAEFDESVVLSIDDGTGYTIGAESYAIVMIADNESPLVSVEPLADGLEGVYSGVFAFHRAGDTTNSLAVSISIGGTATNGTDYTSIGSSVTFAAGEDTALLEVEALSDSTFDPDETVIATITSGTGYSIDTADSATVTIEDAIPVISVQEIGAAYEDGHEGEVLFTRTGDLTDALTVDIAVSGDATADTDYEAISTEVVFAAGESQVFVPVIPIDETTVDPGEVLTLTIQTASGYEVGTVDSVSVMVVDDDSPVVTVTKIADGIEGVAEACSGSHAPGIRVHR